MPLDPYHVADPTPKLFLRLFSSGKGGQGALMFGGKWFMPRIRTRKSSIALMVAFMLSPFLFVACGGRGGSGGGGTDLVSVFASFGGSGVIQGVGPPPILRDDALEFDFGGDIDDGIFGGFIVDSGSMTPTTFQGARRLNDAGGIIPVPYFAFADQAAARAALQVLDNTVVPVNGTHPGIIGRHATKLNTLVFDPNVTPNLSTLFGLPISPGFEGNRQYDIFIPNNSGIMINGQPFTTFGSPPPVIPPSSSNQFSPSTLFVTGPGFLTRPAPRVESITSVYLESINGSPGIDPIPHDDVLIVRFTESIDPATVNAQLNLVVRNTDVLLPPTQPTGIIVPATIVPDAALREYRITPSPSFGGGPFSIVLTIEKFDETIPAENAKNMTGLPQGASGVPLPIQGTTPSAIGVIATATFTTIPEPGQPTVASILEGFDNQDQFAAATPVVPLGGIANVAEWSNIDQMTGLSTSQLRGLTIDGTPIAPNLGVLNPGRRVQFAITPPGVVNTGNAFCMTALCTYSSPFDDNLINNGVAPNGGGRLQSIYLTSGAGSVSAMPAGLTDTFELIEWSPFAQTASPVVYNGFQIRAGHTTRNPNVAAATPTGLDSAWDMNYDMSNPQNEFLNPAAHPVVGNPLYTPNRSPILAFGPAPYPTNAVTLNGTFVPFPRLTLPFDYRDQQREVSVALPGGPVAPNPVFEFITPEPHITNTTTMFVNVVVGTNVLTATPFARNFGRSSSPISAGKDPVVIHMRFTLAKQMSIATSNFYDTSQLNPTYTAFEISPDVLSRPANTQIKVELASKNSSTAPVAEADWETYISLNGVTFINALTNVSGKRYLKARFTFSSDLLTNTTPFLNGFVAGFSF